MLPISLRVVTKMCYLVIDDIDWICVKRSEYDTRMFRLSLNSLPVWMGCLFPTVCW